MKNKTAFSPWQIKQTSFDGDEDSTIIQKYTARLTTKRSNKAKLPSASFQSPFKNNNERQLPQKEQIYRSNSKIDKTNSANYFQAIRFAKDVNQSNLKQHKYNGLQEELKGKSFEKQKWKAMTANCRERFRCEYSQLKNAQNRTEVRSRCNSYSDNLIYTEKFTLQNSQREKKNATLETSEKQKKVLQQVAIKNFIIHGHYSDKQATGILSHKRKQNNTYVMKHKFAQLKKTVNIYESLEQENQPSKRVVIKGNKQKQNLFRVIKLERELNSANMKSIYGNSYTCLTNGAESKAFKMAYNKIL